MQDGDTDDKRPQWLHLQTRVRDLAQEHEWFAEALRQAFTDFIALCQRHQRQTDELQERMRQRAVDLLRRGLVVDPATADNSPSVEYIIAGLCPTALADELSKHRVLPVSLARKAARVALAELERRESHRGSNLSAAERGRRAAKARQAIDAGTHVSFEWTIVLSQTEDLIDPPDPRSLVRDEHGQLADISRFTPEERRTIYLYRLGGVADSGAIEPIIPRPPDGTDLRSNFPLWYWEARLHKPEEPDRAARFFAALGRNDVLDIELVEQMFLSVKQWISSELLQRRQGDDGQVNAGNAIGGVRLKRPIPIVEAAEQVSERSDTVLNRLRSRSARIDEQAKPKTVELDDLLALFPRYRKPLARWADIAHPPAD